ncbi:M42 family peptidase [Oscillospiraceae bacterium 50-16]
MLNMLKELCRLNGVSGDEDEVLYGILDRVRAIPQRQEGEITALYKGDPLRNLIFLKRGKKSTGTKLMLCAHMDEVGIIVTHITDEGFLKFDFVGGVDRRVAIGKPVVIGEKKVPGVIGLKAIHLVEREEEKKVPKTQSLYIDIGVKDRAAAEALVELGDCGAFICEPEEFGDGLFKARAIDDRIGCAIMLKLMEEELPLDVVFAFTAQEEVGTRGAFGAAFSVTPEVALVLETTTAADLPGVEEHRRVCAPGRGPVISYMDGSTIYDRELFENLRRLAEEHRIPWQTKEYIAGGNDARTVQRTKAGVRAAAMSAAVRCLHAPASVGSIADFENMLQLTRLFLREMAEQLEEE